jgi:thiol-disulfide isomerase/thioredoxin
MKGRNTGLAIGVIVAAAAVAGFVVQQRLEQKQQLVPVPVAAPEAPAAETAPAAEPEAVPQKPLAEVLPQFELQDRDGKLRKLGEWTGRPLIVNFWATWCAPCVREIPLLSKLRQDRKAQRLEVIGIAVDFRDDVLAFADKVKLDYPLLIGEEDGLAAIAEVGMQPAFPFTLFADSQQRIVALKVGELHQDEADLILDRIAQVDAGELDLDRARSQITEGLKDIAVRRAAATPG